MDSLKGRFHLEDLNVDGNTVLKDGAEGCKLDFFSDSDQCRAVVNTALNLRVP